MLKVVAERSNRVGEAKFALIIWPWEQARWFERAGEFSLRLYPQ
jgi:hypothetical protein